MQIQSLAFYVWCPLKGYRAKELVGNKAKGRISKQVYKKAKHVKFSEKRSFRTPWYAQIRVRKGVRNVCFS